MSAKCDVCGYLLDGAHNLLCAEVRGLRAQLELERDVYVQVLRVKRAWLERERTSLQKALGWFVNRYRRDNGPMAMFPTEFWQVLHDLPDAAVVSSPNETTDTQSTDHK